MQSRRWLNAAALAVMLVLAAPGAFAIDLLPPESKDQPFKIDLYGILDVAYLARNHVSVDRSAPAASGLTTRGEIFSGGYNQTRLGVNMSFNIAGDWKAVARLEKGFNFDTGTVEDGPETDAGGSAQFFNRYMALGVSNKELGTLTVGRQLTTMYDLVIGFDPMGYAPAFSWMPATGTDTFFTFGTRLDNMVKYAARYPFGLRVAAHYALGTYNYQTTKENAFSFPANAKFGAGAIYSFGPFSALGVYDQVNGADKVGAQDQYSQQTNWVFALAYGSGEGHGLGGAHGYESKDPLSIRGGVRIVKKNKADGTTQRDGQEFFAGIRYQIFPSFTVTLADYWVTSSSSTTGGGNLIVLNPNYSFTKGFDVYATLGYAKAKSGNFAALIRSNDDTPVAESQTGFAFGVRWRFGSTTG